MVQSSAVRPADVEAYRRDGFVAIHNLLDRDEALTFRDAALAASNRLKALGEGPIFRQTVNVWRDDETLRRLTLHPRVTGAARALAECPLRLWHDQLLIKEGGQASKPTEFHQDQPYWPHENSPNPISCWIALGDVPVEAGCMTFLPGSQLRTDLPMQNLGDDRSLFVVCPDLVWSPRVTVPLRAGDVTFHHGRCAHMANANRLDAPRVAHVAIFMDAGVRYNGAGHIVTDPLGLSVGDPLDGEPFPEV